MSYGGSELMVPEEMLLQVWRRIRLIEYDEDGVEHTYDTVIEDLDPSSITVAMPVVRGVLVPLGAGARVGLAVPWEGCAYLCRTTVVEGQSKGLPVLRLARPTQVERLQRRLFVRLAAPLPSVRVRFWSHELEDWQPLHGARAVDLSAGGMLLASPEALQAGTPIKVRFSLPPQTEETALQATVVRCDEDSRLDGRRMHRLGIRFLDITMQQQDAICRFILRRQAEMRRSGRQ